MPEKRQVLDLFTRDELDRIDRNKDIVDHYLNDRPFQETALQAMVKRIYHGIRRSASDSTPPPSGT